MLTKNIKFKNFIKTKNYKNYKILRNIIKDKNLIERYPLLDSLNKNYQYSYQKKKIKLYKNFSEFNLIGMGGSILCSWNRKVGFEQLPVFKSTTLCSYMHTTHPIMNLWIQMRN